MFGKDKLLQEGVGASALVLDQKVYARRQYASVAACRYQLRVRFADGSSAEVALHVWNHKLARAKVGDVIPVRYDPADRSNIEIDAHAIEAQLKAEGQELKEQAIARGQQQLEGSATAAPSRTSSTGGGDERPDEMSDSRISDADREAIGGVLSQHMVEGRLTVDELDERVEALYSARTRAQARSVVAGLPPLPRQHDGPADQAPAVPDWLSAAEPVSSGPRTTSTATGPRSSGTARGGPTDEEMQAAHKAWRAAVTTAKQSKAAHKRAEATGDKGEMLRAFRKRAISQAEEKSARAKFDRLHKLRPEWTSTAG